MLTFPLLLPTVFCSPLSISFSFLQFLSPVRTDFFGARRPYLSPLISFFFSPSGRTGKIDPVFWHLQQSLIVDRYPGYPKPPASHGG
jgi:hypothetical protein